MASVAPKQGSAKSPALQRLEGEYAMPACMWRPAFAHSWSLTILVSKYATPPRLWRHGIHSFLELYSRHDQIRALGKAALHLAGSQDYMRVWSQRSQANSTSGVPWLESCAGEKFRIIHHQIPYLVSYSFDRLRRGSAWLTLRLLRGTSGGQLAQDGNSRAEAADRLRDFEEDIDLALVISDLAGSRERQESRIERDVDAVMLVDKLIPQGEGAAGGEAQPNNGQTNDLRGAGSQFSE